MIQAILITGETYTSRRDLKALGGKWFPDRSGWIVPIDRRDAAAKIASERGFATEEIEVEAVALEHPTGERLRAIRQARLDKKIQKWRAGAERRAEKYQSIEKQLEPYNDWAFWTEPVKYDHHSGKRHHRLRERLQAKMQVQHNLWKEATELTEKADHAERAGVRIAGDAERRREEQRASLDKKIGVGSRVRSLSFGLGTVLKVHKKSYTIQWDASNAGTGSWKCSVDKTYVRPE